MNNTPLTVALDQFENSARLSVRDVYVKVFNYLTSIAPGFERDEARMKQLDQGLGAEPPGEEYTVAKWPTDLKPMAHRYDNKWISRLVHYKGVPLDMYMMVDRIYFRFPPILFKGYRMNHYILRRWKSVCQPSDFNRGVSYRSYEDPPKEFETAAFSKGRVPALTEVMNHDDPLCWFDNINRAVASEFCFFIDWAPELIVAELDNRLKKYYADVKRGKTYEDTSTKNTYNSYVKFRANRLLADYKLAYVALTETQKDIPKKV